MGHRFNDPVVYPEGVADQVLAVPGDDAAAKADPAAAEPADGDQLFPDDGDGVAAVGGVVFVEDLVVLRNQHHLVVVEPQSMPR